MAAALAGVIHGCQGTDNPKHNSTHDLDQTTTRDELKVIK